MLVFLCLYYVDTFKREFVGTNAYKLHAFLNKKVVVDYYSCHTTLKFGVKPKENNAPWHVISYNVAF